MKKAKLTQRLLSLFLCVALLMGALPLHALAASASLAQSAVVGTVADPGTAYRWESMMGTPQDGNRYAGRVWVDKSVYKNGDTALLNTRGEAGSAFNVSLAEDEAFQVIFSALGSTMTSKETTTTTGPMDVILVLDTSTSMDDEDRNGVTRLERTIDAANGLLSDLLTLNNVRIAIVTYNADSETVLPLAAYTNGIELVVTDYYNNGSSDAGVVTAYDKNRRVLGKDDGYTMGTNLQSGIDRGFNLLANATDVEGRVPVAIVLTDGQANRASREGFYELSSHSDKDGTSASGQNLYLSTLLNAAYNKTKIEEHYDRDATVYTVGVDITNNVVARLLMNPADGTNGFHSRNSDNEVRRAYDSFQRWANGENVSYNNWTFNHSYPKQNGAITDAKIAANINYADTYFDVSNADISDTFEQIYEELSSGVFNPISSSITVSGGTGVENTPLIYVDFIGQYMEIKEIQSVTLFGASYGVIRNADGTYTVAAGTGLNPTTGEAWNTARDILITVLDQADGTQKLEIKINQEILPIILEQVISETIGDETTATITEFIQDPLRVYYTVGVDSDVLLPNDKVDVSKIQGYSYIDDQNGTVSFYSNRFGVMNPADNSGTVLKGDAHVGFRPSEKNRYYYHQAVQGIFTKITDKSTGSAVTIPENNEYGIVWDESKYDLNWMTYEEYKRAGDNTRVYNYVTYYHPTPLATDAANAAEEVTYLVYSDWKYMKESVAFYDNNAKTYLNGGAALPVDQVESTVNAYLQANPTAQLYAVLGVGSHRTSRLHNMTVNKTSNPTQTAVEHYAPEYTYSTASVHNGNDVVVWLGNNGRLTVNIDTGIALTKAVTEAIGDPDDTYALTVTVPAGVVASPEVVSENGESVSFTYTSNVLTVNVKAGETVYVSGIPGGTECEIGEIVNGDYYVESKTDRVTVPLVSQVLSGAKQYASAVVTNAPHKYGDLFITKEITGEHALPESVFNRAFTVTVNVGTFLAGKTFTVEDNAHPQPYTVTASSDGSLIFQIKASQTIEIFSLPAGTAVTVTETDPGSNFAVSYRTRDYSGAASDSDNAVTIPAGARSTAVVLNEYTPSSVSVDLDVVINKDFADATVAAHLLGGEFQFAVEKHGWATPIATSSVSYAANEYGKKSVTMADVLKNEVYTKAGTYSYKVYEVKGSVENVTYDRVIYTFDVVVTDNGGQLVATVVDAGDQEIKNVVGDGALDLVTEFKNTYETAPISMDISKTIVNKSGDSAVTAHGFKFKSVAVDQNGNPLNPNAPENATNTIFSDAAGEARISGFYTKEQKGTHYYIVSEANDGKPGWTYSQAQYFVTVVVEEDPSGKLVAVMTIAPWNDAAKSEKAPTVTENNKGQLYFTNTYEPDEVSVNLDGAVSKELTGATLHPDQFTFYVYNNGDRSSHILYGTNDFNGDVRFIDFDKALTFKTVGKYEYDVVESIPTGAAYDAVSGKYVLNGMYYDPTIYDLVVEVKNDSATGKLVASYYFEDAVSQVVTFRNHYEATKTEYALGGVKLLHGRSPRNGEFEFELYEGNNLKETVSNKADGSFTFHPITYTEEGVYTYTIREKAGSMAGIRYDGVQNPVTVTVTVIDVQGVLSASASLENEAIRFENAYLPNAAQLTFNGTKELRGGTLVNNTFTFKLYQTDNTFDVTAREAKLLDTDQNENGAFSFVRNLSATGTYYFVVAEDAENPAKDIVYDGTQYKFTVQVSDLGDGQLKAVATNMTTGVSTARSASVSVGTAFINATFDEAVEKEVYKAGNVTTEIDGKKVEAGDILTYFITYTNYTGENVVVDIMDTIPNHTTYVAGSASHNGTYAGTHVNWILNVEKGESVTVSFDVRVNETEVIVANTAHIRDGVNLYSTNEVVNHTVDEELKKDVFSSADTTVSVDGKKVYEKDELLYKIDFVNPSVAAVDVTITDVIPANTTYVENSADNGGVYKDGKIVWSITAVPAWSTVTVTFKVRVNEKVGAVKILNQATATDGVNHYETDWVTNYTVEDEVEKKVFRVENASVNIDGKSVQNGETLVYTIRYKNTSTEKASVTITDTVPQYTAYVENSADNGGVYKDGVITWTLDVEVGAEVTVSFKVLVKDTDGQTVRNKATVLEGKNTYTTNEVTTPVEKPTSPSVPQTGDGANLHLWFALLFVSSGGIITTAICGKKKKELKEGTTN